MGDVCFQLLSPSGGTSADAEAQIAALSSGPGHQLDVGHEVCRQEMAGRHLPPAVCVLGHLAAVPDRVSNPQKHFCLSAVDKSPSSSRRFSNSLQLLAQEGLLWYFGDVLVNWFLLGSNPSE